MPTPDPAVEPAYNCHRVRGAQARHKVITGDGICCVCGRQGVVDAASSSLPLFAPSTGIDE